MKFVNLVILVFLVKSLSSQTSNDSLNIQLSDITVSQDTITGMNKYKLVYKLTIQQIANLKYLDISVLNQSDGLVVQIGAYDLKTHSNGFNYLESSTGEKKSIMGNDVFFTSVIDQSIYTNCWKVKLNYTSAIMIQKTAIKPISH
ncbi:MAG: hypothetical protein JSU07_02910 [Bacteroidetes bacterium]|nr:hypothetical protein [Bacteroidota bacterium]